MIRKLAELPEPKVCRHREHYPPQHISLQPGIYEHTCPACGRRSEFVVRGLIW